MFMFFSIFPVDEEIVIPLPLKLYTVLYNLPQSDELFGKMILSMYVTLLNNLLLPTTHSSSTYFLGTIQINLRLEYTCILSAIKTRQE